MVCTEVEEGSDQESKAEGMYVPISSQLRTQDFYSTSFCCIAYRASSALVFMHIFSRILAR